MRLAVGGWRALQQSQQRRGILETDGGGVALVVKWGGRRRVPAHGGWWRAHWWAPSTAAAWGTGCRRTCEDGVAHAVRVGHHLPRKVVEELPDGGVRCSERLGVACSLPDQGDGCEELRRELQLGGGVVHGEGTDRLRRAPLFERFLALGAQLVPLVRDVLYDDSEAVWTGQRGDGDAV